ncbi:response regulator [Parasediminibacterium sp. JCM 36343]|uniref:response regulator n=1 Tax=Parasediminibacterium sp. JCM 36343 TaxID=3374279 RepID=UPI00397A3573
MTTLINILIIEDNEVHLYLLNQYLTLSSLRIGTISHAASIDEALTVLDTEVPNIIFLDLFLPDSEGLESYTIIQNKIKTAAIIVISSLSDINTTLEALALGAEDYLVKGEFDDRILEKTVRYSIERKKSEIQLQASEAKYRQIFYNNPSPMYIYDLETLNILECNEAAVKTYQYAREEFTKLSILDLRPPELRVHPVINDPNELKNLLSNPLPHQKKNGDIIMVEISFYHIEMNEKVVRQVQINDVTEKIELQKALTAQQEEKQRSITAATITAQETERAELGRELHDNINQILVTALLFLDNVIVTQKIDFERLKYIKQIISESIKEIRKLTKGLVPPALDNIGLVQALEGVLSNLRVLDNMTINTSFADFSENLISEDQKLMIYRIAQEQLNNIVKHSGASVVDISLQLKDESLELAIKDNGKGCDLTEKRNGVGLQNISTRAALHHGKVFINSAPNQGFELAVNFPIMDEA